MSYNPSLFGAYEATFVVRFSGFAGVPWPPASTLQKLAWFHDRSFVGFVR